MELTKLLFLVVQLICVIPKTSAQIEFLYNLCGDNYSTPSTYQRNLNTALQSMSSDTRITYGYYNFSAGQKPNKVEAMALCRADIPANDCRSCVRSSAASLPVVCHNTKQAFAFSENCVIYYTDTSAFHVLADSPYYAIRFNRNLTFYPKFNSSLNTLMTTLINQASLGNAELKFATGSTKLTSKKTLYGLVQCSPDLSRLDCVRCVKSLISNVFTEYFVTVTKGSLFIAEGGRVVSPSCNVRYEIYPFYKNVTYIAQPPASNRNATLVQAVDGSKSHKTIAIVVSIVGSLVLVLIIASICILLRMKKQRKFSGSFNKEELDNLQSLQFSVGVIKVATENFADDNKLGEGGSGTVYKGKLPDGQEIAVKRFERDAVLGDIQFKNEILTLAKLHHKNLVRLLGFCLEEDEMLLIYEFVINKSLDNFLDDPVKRASMHWETRCNIINGIARGLLYLHEESRMRIIHRDLKAANVLLDADFIPKIADFGLAKLFKIDQSQAVTSKVVGTGGYMPPEYLIQGQVSLKSDVFSFGVLVLEIISGQRISSFQIKAKPENLLTFAWKNWLEGNAWSLVDPALSPASTPEILRCIHIGLLCVQNNMADRPTMSSVSLMLSSFSMTLEVPSQPAFFSQNPTLNAPSEENASDQSNSNTINDVSVTELYPR